MILGRAFPFTLLEPSAKLAHTYIYIYIFKWTPNRLTIVKNDKLEVANHASLACIGLQRMCAHKNFIITVKGHTVHP